MSDVSFLDSFNLGHDLSFEEDLIVNFDRHICKLRTKEIASVKMGRKHRSIGKWTRESMSDILILLKLLILSFALCLRTNIVVDKEMK